jgi:pyrroloquinoline quinone biosynthesis protein B
MNFYFKYASYLFFWVFITNCQNTPEIIPAKKEGQSIIVLGIAQDAGFPQANCQKKCCKKAWSDPATRKMVSCLAVLDYESGKYWIFDATPDFKDQIALAQKQLGSSGLPEGIFLTHAHVGHYTGLMELGREVIGSNKAKVYAMPKMKAFLEDNGPWSQLVSLENIAIQALENEVEVQLSPQLSVKPFLVPHRDEYSETVGYEISGPNKKVLFIPDINKWKMWDKDITTAIQSVDYAFLDGSFYQNGEIPGRDMSEIPHPFLVESMAVLDGLGAKDKAKVHFIHFNHTNPVLDESAKEHKAILAKGYKLAKEKNSFGI